MAAFDLARELSRTFFCSGSQMPVLQPFAALYVLILASASLLLAKESERIYDLYAGLVKRLGTKKKSEEEEVEAVDELDRQTEKANL